MTDNPYQSPQSLESSPSAPVDAAQLYSRLPWYRKSSYVSPITLLGLCCGPAILVVCVIVLTGDVYYKQLDAAGNLKKWGVGNKVAAIIILLFQVFFITSQLIAAFYGPSTPVPVR
jgi:hypothetical protein